MEWPFLDKESRMISENCPPHPRIQKLARLVKLKIPVVWWRNLNPKPCRFIHPFHPFSNNSIVPVARFQAPNPSRSITFPPPAVGPRTPMRLVRLGGTELKRIANTGYTTWGYPMDKQKQKGSNRHIWHLSQEPLKIQQDADRTCRTLWRVCIL